MAKVSLPGMEISYTEGDNMHLYVLIFQSGLETLDVSVVVAANMPAAFATGQALGIRVERVVPMMDIMSGLATGKVDISRPSR
ncbi:MAG: hypothetical protein LUO89_11310 [Methanothrix sp.]|nr:hypothetical protein [Methanothrix sp.]